MTFNLTEVLLKPDDDLETCKSKFNLLLADHRHRCNIIYHYQKKVSLSLLKLKYKPIYHKLYFSIFYI